MLSSNIRLKVQSVKAMKDVESREGYQIDFVEVRRRPPVVTMTPKEIPEEISQMVVQITKSVQNVVPGGNASNTGTSLPGAPPCSCALLPLLRYAAVGSTTAGDDLIPS